MCNCGNDDNESSKLDAFLIALLVRPHTDLMPVGTKYALSTEDVSFMGHSLKLSVSVCLMGSCGSVLQAFVDYSNKLENCTVL